MSSCCTKATPRTFRSRTMLYQQPMSNHTNEWLLQDPFMYLPCNMQTNQANNNVLGGTNPLSPLNGEDTMEGFMDLSQTFKCLSDDDLQPTDIEHTPSPYSDLSTCHNTVDPDSFLANNEQRSRLYSTSSSWGASPLSWANSPYSELDSGILSPHMPSPFTPNNNIEDILVQQPVATKHDIGRQTSLSMALEVLGGIELGSFAPNTSNYPLTPESSTYAEDEIIPSPFENYITPSSAPARQRCTSGFVGVFCKENELFDDGNSRIRAFSADNTTNGEMDVEEFLKSINVIPTEDNKDVNSNNKNNNYVYAVTSCDNTQTTSTSTTDEITSLDAIDITQMLDEIQQPLPKPSKPRPSTTELAKFIGSEHDYSAPQKVLAPQFQPSSTPVILPHLLTSSPRKSPKKPLAQKPSTSRTKTSPTSIIVDLTKEETTIASSINKVGDVPQTSRYKRKRARNNESCRESRKKKKTVRSEAENRLLFLNEDNEAMRAQIVKLEKEVRETRETLLSRMTGKSR